ncbi:MAG TPA: TPM domain-containing protein, partial [Chthoniobacterales bacterium]|nr:TPM domain-containing protein [Chthoniobacterales bacterium]
MKNPVSSNAVIETANNVSRFGLRWSKPALVLFFSFAVSVLAAEKLPPPPNRYFNDYASLVRPEVAEQLNRQLADFERQTSNQILVAIYPKFPSETSLEDYTQQVARSWRAGTN